MRKKAVSDFKVGKDYIFVPGAAWRLDWAKLLETWPDPRCYLVVLDERQIDVLLSHLSCFPRYHWLWGLPSPRIHWDAATTATWDTIEAFTAELEDCLMSGCDINKLIITNRLLVGAITGQVVDLDQPLPTSGTVDFSTNGLSPQLRYNGQGLAEITKDTKEEQHIDLVTIADAIEAIEAKLEEIRAVIEVGEDLEDDLAAVWAALNAVAAILGASVPAPPAPL